MQLTSSTAGNAAPGEASVRFIKDPGDVPDLVLKTSTARRSTATTSPAKSCWSTSGRPGAAVPRRDSRSHQAAGSIQRSGGDYRCAVRGDAGPHVTRFAAEYRMNYPIVPETKELGGFTGIYALPTTFMVGADLKMMQKHVGQIRPSQIELEARVSPASRRCGGRGSAGNKEAVLASSARD